MQSTTATIHNAATVNATANDAFARALQNTKTFEKAIEASKRARWEIERDVIGGRAFDRGEKFLPDGLSLLHHASYLSNEEKRYLSQIQGRTYANVFGLVERFINAKVLELSRDYFFGDQVALEALVRFSDEELKHQELFRRIERLASEVMPPGYTFLPDPNDVAHAVLSKSTWAVLALTLHIELFTQQHYRESIEPDAELSKLYRDVFRYHWMEEAQHAKMDEVELIRCDATLSAAQRDQAVNDFIDLVGAVDGILQAQSLSDANYFAETCGRSLDEDERALVRRDLLEAYRWQYILSGAQHPRFVKVLTSLVTDEQAKRVVEAVGSLA